MPECSERRVLTDAVLAKELRRWTTGGKLRCSERTIRRLLQRLRLSLYSTKCSDILRWVGH